MHRTAPRRLLGALCAATLLAALPALATASDVVRAYPAFFELTRVGDDGKRTLASGEVLLKEDRTVETQQDSADTRVRLAFRVERTDPSARRLALDVNGAITVARGQRRVAAEGASESYIAGPDSERITLDHRAWQSLADPSPVRMRHQGEDAEYVLILMFDAAAFR